MTVAKTRPLLIATSVFALLAGCEDTLKRYGEAGSPPAYYGLGSSVDMNAGYHTGDYVFDFAQRFHDTVPDTVNFAFNSAVLDAEAQAVLRKQAHFIRQFPEVRWKVYGHTDLVGSNAYNQRLGLRRAQAVVAYLASQGVSRKRLQAVVSYGETRPLIATQDRERRNRRTVTEVSGFVADAPLILDGKYAQVIRREYVQSATEIPPPPAATVLSGNSE
ncbi:MAG: OmpA family protein [Maritimibacter sp.]|nr:OmpA family protein [Maritimibacter sp.]